MAKRLYYNGLITNSENKIKTTWNIVKSVTGKNLVNKLPVSMYKWCPTRDQARLVTLLDP
jgi:hypothetical protein